MVTHLPEVNASPDPDDNPILATAIAGRAGLVVSGDKKHMLALGHIDGIPDRLRGRCGGPIAPPAAMIRRQERVPRPPPSCRWHVAAVLGRDTAMLDQRLPRKR